MSATELNFDLESGPIEFAGYVVRKLLCSDALVEEYLATIGDGDDTRAFVVRCPSKKATLEQQFVTLFLDENLLISRTASTNVVPIVEVGEIEGQPFVVREHIPGGTLARLLELAKERNAPWPWELAVHVACEILRGLDHVHRRKDVYGQEANLRHGDIRPPNIYVSSEGEVKLTNFGSSFYLLLGDDLKNEWLTGRRDFTTDESGVYDKPTVLGDLFGVTAILWTLLTGEAAPRREYHTGKMWVPPSLTQIVESLPPGLDSFWAKALNPDRSYRFLSATEMRTELSAIIKESAVGHAPDDLAGWVRDLTESDERSLNRIIYPSRVRSSLKNTQLLERDPLLETNALLDGRYRLTRQLGEGGMGVVYEAEHEGLGRKAAIKVLHQKSQEDDALVERFRREARMVGSLGHPNIVSVFDFGTTGEGQLYLAMELLEGEALGRRFSRGPLPSKELVKIMSGVCRGLQAAHNAGVIHRDLKPDNVFLTLEGPKLLDFGIARRSGLADTETNLTKTGHICGTAEYVSPEQVRGDVPDNRSDIFSLGVIMYEALTGKSPFRGKSVGDILDKLLNMDIIPPRELTGDLTIPYELEGICMKALARKPDERFQNAEEMAWALLELLPPEERAQTNPELAREVSTRPSFASEINVKNERSQVKGAQRRYTGLLLWFVVVPTVLLFVVIGLAQVKSMGGWDALRINLFGAGGFASGKTQAAPESPKQIAQKPATKVAVGPGASSSDTAAPSVVTSPAPSSGSAKKSKHKWKTKSRGRHSKNQTASKDRAFMTSDTQAASQQDPQSDIKLQKNDDAKKQARKRARELIAEGELAYRSVNYSQARRLLSEATRLSAREAEGWYWLGMSCYQIGQHQEALGHLQRALKYSPGRANWRVRLGQMYLELGDRQSAVNAWKRVLKTNPNHKEAKAKLAKAGIAVE